MEVNRFKDNPIITPDDVSPYHESHEVIGVFNAGIAEYKGETLMLLRVAERPLSQNNNIVKAPIIDFSNNENTLKLIELDRKNPAYDFSDPRTVRLRQKEETAFLTSLSYIRLARSKDGQNFTVDEQPFLYPEAELEAWGIEDPRVTQIEDTYYIQYSAVSEKGVGVGLISTKDFNSYERHGLILHPENKDVAIFPEQINGKYYALHRPVPKGIGRPEIWIAESDNLLHWGNHKHLLGLREGSWDSGRIGGGAVPFKTDKGWLEIYHAADTEDRYCLGAVLLDLDNPAKVLAKTDKPILEPKADYEVNGFFDQVVFTCGVTLQDDRIRIYYGVADTSMALAEISLKELLAELTYEKVPESGGI
ncbi:glycoside hydrolase family 130 protein [Halobacillus halophilus]|uniref:BtaManbiosPhlase n=1 Tax=Halobacillus halophilus TaxID=1570 RepID=UPI001CD50C49|nr:glycoside hydrolase family 130 protein [Halobacillus halophilus]MCA1010672.1 glycoside hydrolase family 130 protein [Halobacillus halophilus]